MTITRNTTVPLRVIEFTFIVNKIWTFEDGSTNLPFSAPGNITVSCEGD